MNISKTSLFVSDDSLSMSFAFTKVDKDKRRITGIATADNVDSEGDLIDFEASQKAFKTWVGNIREMHGPKAVGKAVNAKEIMVTGDDGRQYRGVEVTAYISKGANDTWEKILDGTLTGFSVGGRILEKSKEFHKSEGKIVTRIKNYILGELSVVDNPANPLAQFTMIKSSGDGELSLVKEAEPTMEFVFYCEKDGIAKVNDQICSACGEEMIEIGYVESVDLNEPVEIEKMIEAYELSKVSIDHSGTVEAIEAIENKIGGTDLLNNNNSDNINTMDLSPKQRESLIGKFASLLFGASQEESVEKAISTEEVETVASTVEDAGGGETEEVIEKSATEEVEEVSEVEEVIEKSEDTTEADTSEEEILEKSAEEGEEMGFSLDDIKAALSEAVAPVAARVEEVAKSVETLSEEVETVKKGGAVKKSLDADVEEEVEEEVEPLKKSAGFWGNVFVPQNVIEALGYES